MASMATSNHQILKRGQGRPASRYGCALKWDVECTPVKSTGPRLNSCAHCSQPHHTHILWGTMFNLIYEVANKPPHRAFPPNKLNPERLKNGIWSLWARNHHWWGRFISSLWYLVWENSIKCPLFREPPMLCDTTAPLCVIPKSDDRPSVRRILVPLVIVVDVLSERFSLMEKDSLALHNSGAPGTYLQF